MKFNNKSDNFQLAKDVQRLEDAFAVQTVVNSNNAKSHRATGWAIMLLSAAGYLIVDGLCKLEKRVKALEEQKNKKELPDDPTIMYTDAE